MITASAPTVRRLLACILLLALPAPASEGAALIYRKVFKGSVPEYVEIRVGETGSCAYDIRFLSDDPEPQPFELSQPLVAKLFELAAQLNHFRGLDLDLKRRIAYLGQKTFRYERGSEAWEVSFNYTTHPTATQLLRLFEGIARQQEHYDTLKRRLRYDRLGINDSLVRFEAELNRGVLPEPQRMLPLLEEVAADARIIEIARQRARALIERLRTATPAQNP